MQLLLLSLLILQPGHAYLEAGQGVAVQQLGISNDLCRAPGETAVCSGHGQCSFGQCRCTPGWSGRFCSECQDCKKDPKCEELRPCVESEVFGQYWKHFASAYQARTACSQYSFISPSPAKNCACTADQRPICGLNGETFSNSCLARCAGVAEQCPGQCPCPQSGSYCEFHKNLPEDAICPPYRFHVQGSAVAVYRPPCLANDLKVNGGVWRGEQARKEGSLDTYPHGWGTLTYAREDPLERQEYRGSMSWGQREGRGSLTWQNGAKYAGQWHEDRREGQGTLFYPNQDVYDGSWAGEKKSGKGSFIFSSGGNYTGEFRDGKKCGTGETRLPVNKEKQAWVSFIGEYGGNGGRKSGIYRTHTGDVYDGEFDEKTGEFQGKGKYSWACGKKYTGNFKSGQPDGQGELQYPKGWTYVGSFKAGKFHGKGKFTWSQLHFYEGEFKEGAMTGLGVYGMENGSLYDSSVGLYYPDRKNRSVFKEAHFDGKVLRVKAPSAKKPIGKGGYS